VQLCDDFAMENSSIINSSNAGLLLKESDKCQVQDNLFSGNLFGLALWNSSCSQVRRNRADHNYYGILITDSSNHNTIADNVVEENSRGEIVKGFGVGSACRRTAASTW